MYVAADVIGGMTRSLRRDRQNCLTEAGAGLAIAPQGETITALPEFHPPSGESDSSINHGAWIGQPIAGVVEDPLLHGNYESVVHGFAHAIQNLCFSEDEQTEWNRFYWKARRSGLLSEAHGMTNALEFFAEFSASYFDWPDDIQRRWDMWDDYLTRQKLSADFPEIFSFLEGIFEGWEVGSYFGPDLVSPDRDILIAPLRSNWRAPIGPTARIGLATIHLSNGTGVATNDARRVTRLELAHNQLSGEIPPELGNLANLGELSLDGNQLTGEPSPGTRKPSQLAAIVFGKHLVQSVVW